MDPFFTNSTIWANIYKSGKSDLSFPNENLVRLSNYLFVGQDVRKLKLLDYGFGSGNNLKFLFDRGFDVYGLEVSEAAKVMALSKLGSSFPSVRLAVVDAREPLPYADNTFDVVVAWQVLYYNTLESLRKAVTELYRVLKPGGIAIFTMCRAENTTAINSFPTNKNERIVDERVPTQAGAHIIVLETEEEVRQVFKIFYGVQVGYFIGSLCGATSAHWVAYGSKE